LKYPRWIEFIPELPKTATGKIQRYQLREQLSKQAESDLEGRASDGASQS
jgi:acyl-coenzyme A synthetase/AMP-(fatty) acid ligase